MLPTPHHRRVAADAHQAPLPFRSFAVRSDEPQHALQARSPYGAVHVVRTLFVDAGSLVAIVNAGYQRVHIDAPLEIDYAPTTLQELAAIAPPLQGLAGWLAEALQLSGVLGPDLADYQRSVATRIDYLASRGAGFHNDVSRHWSRCLFWVLTLDVSDIEFVMPHAGLRLALSVGDLIVFDQTMAHGLCRPRDAGQALACSFENGNHGRQLFLTGELLLSDAQWTALGSPWLPVQVHEARGALDLLVAQFDERSGTIQRLHSLQGGMQRSRCHVDESAT